MFDGIVVLINVAALYLISQYLLGPILIWLTFRAPARYSYPPIPAQSYLGALPLNPRAKRSHEALLQMGFEFSTVLDARNIRAAVYIHRCDPATATVMQSRAHTGVEFCQAYANGKRLSLLSSRFPGVFPDWNRKICYRVPENTDIVELFRIFQTLRQKAALGETVAGVAGEEQHRIESFSDDELQHLIERGYYSARVSKGKHAVTFKGAVIMTCRVALPSRPLIRARDRKRLEQALAS